MPTSTGPPAATDGHADRLARLVASEAFAVAFLWWAVLVALAPACFVCAWGFHREGAATAAAVVGAIGLVVALVSVARLASETVTLRRLAAA